MSLVPVSDFALQLASVTYRYPGSSHGVSDVTLSAPSNSIYALVGANGAGKTTLMRLMTGLLRPTAGRVRCLGVDVGSDRTRLLRSVGSLIETPSLYDHLQGHDHLRVFAAYTGAPSAAIPRVLSQVGLSEAGGRCIREYSLGMKQRLGIATALLHDPQVLILDEPTNGLDPMGIADMRSTLLELANTHGKTVIISSHLLSEVEKIAARIAVIHEGRVRFEGSALELTAASRGSSQLQLRVSSTERARDVLGAFATENDETVAVPCADSSAAADMIRKLVLAGVDVYEARREEPSLERGFLALVEPANA